MNTMQRPCTISRLITGAILLVTTFVSTIALAADKALLIGIGSYKNSAYNLSGIDLDLAAMHRIALRLGYKDANIKTLTGPAVTQENIESAFSQFLVHDTKPTDKILIYYSGHGVQLTDDDYDETDGRDEALTLHTLEPTDFGYSGVLRDDDLSSLLRSLPSRHVFVVVDACHSGTVTRGVTTPIPLETQAYGETVFQVKNLPFRQAPRDGITEQRGVKRTINTDHVPGIINLSAAQDHEKALATKRGSAFTMALAESFDTLGTNASVRELFETASDILVRRIDPKHVFRPNLTGDDSSFEQTFSISNTPELASTNWDYAMRIARRTPALNAGISRRKYYEDESIEITLELSQAGYINVLGIDADDNLVLLFPNRHHTDNHVFSGSTVLPGELGFEWNALEPWGENLILVVQSLDPVNLFINSLQKNRDGNTEYDFVLPSIEDMRKIGFLDHAEFETDMAATTLQFSTCHPTNDC